MATSGIIQTSTYTWTAGDGNKKSIYYTTEWERTSYSIVDNTSTVKFTIKAVKSTRTWGVNEKKIKLTLDGEEIYYRGGTVSRKASATVAEVTKVINHNADGNKRFSLYLELAVGGSDNPNKSASGSFSLDWIPRQSPIGNSTAEVVVTGSNKQTISWAPYVASYSHKVTWSIGTYNYSQTIATGTNTASYAIPKDWLRSIPSATSGTATVKLETFDGSTQIGTASTQTFTIKCAGNETPNCSIAASDANGFYNKIAAYIINQSKIKVDVTGIAYQYGASLKSVAVTIGTTTYTTPATSVTAQSNINAASTAVTVVLTDSRGYTVTKTLTVTAYAYVLPALSLSINRYHNNNGTYEHDDEGEYGRVVYTASITQIGNNALQNVKIDWVAADGSGSGTRTLTTMDGDIYVECDTEKVYTFTLTITDKLNTVVYRKQLSSAVTIMDIIVGGDGVCFGGVATKQGVFDERWRAEFADSVKLPYILAQDRAGAPQTAIIPLPWLTFRDFGTSGYEAYFKALCKWICQNYRQPQTGLWIGVTVPDAQGIAEITIYNTDETDAAGYPRYATGRFHGWNNDYCFSFYDYVYSEVFK